MAIVDRDRPPPEVLEEMDRVFGALEATAPQPAPKRRTPHTTPFGNDMVVLPKHYARFSIEPIRFIAENSLDFLAGNIIKYTARAEHKHGDAGLEDSLKIVRYTIMRAKKLAGNPDWWKPYKNPDLARLIEEEMSYHGAT